MGNIEKTRQFMEQYLKNYRNYKEYWNYEDGCVLKAARDFFETTGEEKYITFILNYLKGYM